MKYKGTVARRPTKDYDFKKWAAEQEAKGYKARPIKTDLWGNAYVPHSVFHREYLYMSNPSGEGKRPVKMNFRKMDKAKRSK